MITETSERQPVTTSGAEPELTLYVRRVSWEAEGVISLELADIDHRELPEWEPGAHLEVVLPSGAIRQYSLCGRPSDRHRYTIAVLREAAGRGGSAEIHDTALVGKTITARGPRNRFELGYAAKYLFIVGGIGITPILPMVSAVANRKPWKLYFGGRSRKSMAFAEQLANLGRASVAIVPQDEAGILDLDAILASADGETAIYCCGPEGLISAVQERCERSGISDRLHFERFAAAPVKVDEIAELSQGAFEVELTRAGCTVVVQPGQSILEAIRDVVDMPSSCEEGICGTCETRVLSGTPDHRDSILTSAERAENRTMFPCVSRSKSPRLTLDV